MAVAAVAQQAESVAYADQLWADGGACELHVWPGGTHAWKVLIADSPMARQAASARSGWLGRLLARPASA
ncbi:hypothetical protein ACFP2T_17780 [Plantactinospora solaniradicis]|uniref:Alpha/beta hydrolase fold-3 domain-containing protein n=1 Tax=Plantactinospora solaniradicis TaxID=1723736 RepID=A0ABW1KA09_9ACTN